MKRVNTILIAVIAAITLSSCASIFGGSTYQAQIIPENPKATVYVNGEKEGTGNVYVTQKRKRTMDIKIVNPDGATKELEVTRQFRWGIQVANVAGLWWWFPIATAVDMITGGAWKPNENIRGVRKIDTNNYKIKVNN